MKSHSDTIKSGSLLILSASMLWGIGYFLRKLIMNDISPFLLSFFNAVIASVALSFYLKIKPAELYYQFRSHPLNYLGLALSGVVLGSTLMFFALDKLDLSLATVLIKLQPIFTVLMAWLFLDEKISFAQVIYILIAIVSSYLLATNSISTLEFKGSDTLGLLAVIAAAFFWALTSIIGKRTLNEQICSERVTVLRFAIASILFVVLIPLIELSNLFLNATPKVLAIIVLSSIFSTALGYLLYYQGLNKISVLLATPLELSTPLTGILLGMTLLDEKFAWSQVIATITLLFSTYKLVRSYSDNPLNTS